MAVVAILVVLGAGYAVARPTNGFWNGMMGYSDGMMGGYGANGGNGFGHCGAGYDAGYGANTNLGFWRSAGYCNRDAGN